MFVGLLMGFLTQMSRGRFWDEKTGTITEAQAVGLRVEALNMPLKLCCEGTIEYPPPEILYMYCTSDDDESEETMGCPCTVDKRAFDIRNGNELWVNDACEGWVKVGSFLVGTGDVDPDNPPVVEPPSGLTGGTSCAKALKLAQLTHDIIDAGFNAVNLGLNDPSYFLFGWYDFADIVRQAIPNVNLGDQDLYTLFYMLYILEPLGLESETESPTIQAAVACALNGMLGDGPAGITSDQYDAAKAVVYSAARSVAPSGTNNTIPDVWKTAFSAIGPNDAAKITANLPDVDSDDCACPGSGVIASSIYFTGEYDEGTSSATIEGAQMKDSGRRFRLQFAMDAGQSYKKVFAFDCNVDGAEAGDDVTVRLYPNLAAYNPGDLVYYPGAIAAQDATKPVIVSQWNNISFMADDDTGISATRTNDPDGNWVEFTSENPGGKVINRVRIAEGFITPSNAAQYAYNRDILEIVAVNGVRLTPLGPTVT